MPRSNFDRGAEQALAKHRILPTLDVLLSYSCPLGSHLPTMGYEPWSTAISISSDGHTSMTELSGTILRRGTVFDK